MSFDCGYSGWYCIMVLYHIRFYGKKGLSTLGRRREGKCQHTLGIVRKRRAICVLRALGQFIDPFTVSNAAVNAGVTRTQPLRPDHSEPVQTEPRNYKNESLRTRYNTILCCSTPSHDPHDIRSTLEASNSIQLSPHYSTPPKPIPIQTRSTGLPNERPNLIEYTSLRQTV